MPRKKKTKLKLEKRKDGWWIVNGPGVDHGPYSDRSEAMEDRAGLERFWVDYEKTMGQNPED